MTIKNLRRALCPLTALALAGVACAVAQEDAEHQHDHAAAASDLGAVHFPISCDAGVQPTSIARSRCCTRSATSSRATRSAPSARAIRAAAWRGGAWR